jgi:hypothetical protein
VSLSRIEIKKIKRNAIIGSIILFIIATLHLIKGHTGFYRFLYSLAGFLFIVGGFFPKIFKQITDAVGKLIVSVLLSVIYFIVVTPIGTVMRIFGKDTLDKNIDKEKDSYWVKKDPENDISAYEKQY